MTEAVIPERRPSLLEQVSVLNRREGGVLEAYVPISLIYTQDVPVDITHVRELASSIEAESKSGTSGTKTGQLSPVLLGEVPGFGQFPIIDGFHRVPALKSLSRQEVFATIRPNSTWEEIIDLRILAATTHRAVRFSRLIEWIEESWQYSRWAEKMRPIQAFQLLMSRTMTGVRSGLTPEDAEDVRKWVSEKCDQWHVSPALIYKNLSIARVADPDLIKETRERRSGHILEAITPQHLQAIATTLPYRYDIQKLVADATKKYGLTVGMSRTLATFVANTQSIEEAKELIQSEGWVVLGPTHSPTSSLARGEKRPINIKENQDYQELINKFFEDEIQISRLMIENAILTGRYIPNISNRSAGRLEVVPQEEPSEADDVFAELDIKPTSDVSEDEKAAVFGMIDGMRQELISYLYNKYGVKPEDGEDLISDAVVKLLSYANDGKLGHDYLERGRLKALMLRAVQFTRVDWLREVHGRRGQHPYLASILDVRGDHYSKLGYDEEGFDNVEDDTEEYRQLVRHALPQLSEQQRRVLVLKVYFNLDSNSIGQILGKNPITLDSVYSQTKRKLSKLLTVRT